MSDRAYISTDSATLFIGGFWLDDAHGLEYQIADPKEPLYGYRSRQFDDIAEGQTIVHGMLDINFRFKGYLALVLARLQNLERIIKDAGDLGDDPLRAALFALQNDNDFRTSGIDPAGLSAAARASLLTTPHREFDIRSFRRLAQAMQDDLWTDNRFTGRQSQVKLTGVRPGAWPDGFDLDIVYQQTNPTDNLREQDNALVERLKGVHIVGQSKILINAVPGGGEAVIERYQFLAKEVV